MTIITLPDLTTDRLILRAPCREDFDHYAPVLTSQRARHLGGPYTRMVAWTSFASDIAGWVLDGIGYWAITARNDGRFLGLAGVGINRTFPEPQLGWALIAAAEGHGYATEAAMAVRDDALGRFGLTRLVSYIGPGNTRSVALAQRLGAWHDTGAARPHKDDQVWRHAPSAPQQGDTP